MRNYICLLCCVISLASCGDTRDEHSAIDTTAMQPQEIAIMAGVRTTLSCKLNATNSYDVYLPVAHGADQKYPVVIFFDPHGDGRVPLEKYKSIADEWEFILVGSNSSKNGMESILALSMGNELVTDVAGKFNVDPARIYLSGFSGGARVAGGVALQRMDITGIICCSATPPSSVAPRGYIGVAGLGDMNYLEMKKFQSRDTSSTGLSELLVFDGKHEWPPVKVMENAMLMISLYQPGIAVSGDPNEMSDSLSANVLAQADTIGKMSCMLEYNLLSSVERAEKNLSGSAAITERKKKISLSCVMNDEKKWAKAEATESDLQKALAESVLSRDTVWWRENADSYFETTKPGPEKFLSQRLRGYVSLLCYTYCNQAFSMNNLHAAEKLVKVYSIVDPTNSEWAYLQSGLYMRLNMYDYAVSSMDSAVTLGFNDRQRVERDPVFAPVMSDAAFQLVLAKMN